jgi:ABC-type lipoprotein export system ATPase subunit
LFDGADIWSSTEIERTAFRCRYIGFVFQFPSVRSNLTVVDNVAVPTMLGRTWSQRSRMREPIIYLRAPVFPSVAKVDPGAMSVRAERMAILADMARSGLRSEIQAVADPYQLAVYLLTPTSLRGYL